MNVWAEIPFSTDARLAVARSLGHTSPSSYPVLKRWMEDTLQAALGNLIKSHIKQRRKVRRPRRLPLPPDQY